MRFYPHDRIKHQHRNHAEHMAEYHPAGSQPMVMPLSIVTVTADGMQIEEATPLVTDRGVVPATGRGEWGQVHAAGRP